jgi:hypothetical protein
MPLLMVVPGEMENSQNYELYVEVVGTLFLQVAVLMLSTAMLLMMTLRVSILTIMVFELSCLKKLISLAVSRGLNGMGYLSDWGGPG